MCADLEFLVRTLPHRSANSDEEHRAAEFIRDRLREDDPTAGVESFQSTENIFLAISMYYMEFVVVGIAATWWPVLALAYGGAVFLMYLSELHGYALASRLLSRFETQNVVSRRSGISPRATIVITAHYDSPKTAQWRYVKGLRAMHWLICTMILLILVTCIAQAFEIDPIPAVRLNLTLRWAAIACLAGAGAVIYLSERNADTTRGAIDNASGVIAMLALSSRFARRPLPCSELWFVALGAHESGWHGMRHLLATTEFDRESTWFVDLDSVGGGDLTYQNREGILQTYAMTLEQFAKDVAIEFAAAPATNPGLPSAAFLAAARGFRAVSIVGSSQPGDMPGDVREESYPVASVDLDTVQYASSFAERIVRRIDDVAGQNL